MQSFNKFFAALIAGLVAGLSGPEAFIADVLPPEVLPYAIGAIPVLVALVPNGRPFWQITQPSVGTPPPPQDDPTMRVQAQPAATLIASVLAFVVLLIVLAAASACAPVTAARQATVEPALRLYHGQACAAGPVGELVRADQRAGVYAATGVYLEADCGFRPGDTVDDFLARKQAAAGFAAPAVD